MADAGALRAELAQRIMGFMVSQAVYVAAKLDVAGLLAEGPRSADDLAGASRTDADALYRVLRLLAAYGIFVEQEGRTFANTELSELLHDGFADFAITFGELCYPALGELLQAVQTGEPTFERLFGVPWDDHLAANRELSHRFNRFMAGGKDDVAAALAELPWRGDETVVDVGGGNGTLLLGLLRRQPGLRGIVFDLTHVIHEAAERIRESGLADRCEALAGSFFETVPAGDVYVLSHILHGMNDALAGELLERLRGRVLIHDGVVAPPNEPRHKLLDLLMFVLSGGRERTETEWRALLSTNGFELRAIHPSPEAEIIEAVRS